MLKNQDNTLDLSTITEEVKNLYKVVTTYIDKLNTPKSLLTLVYKIDPMELAGGETTLTETLSENGNMLLLLTQPPSKSSPPVDALDAP